MHWFWFLLALAAGGLVPTQAADRGRLQNFLQHNYPAPVQVADESFQPYDSEEDDSAESSSPLEEFLSDVLLLIDVVKRDLSERKRAVSAQEEYTKTVSGILGSIQNIEQQRHHW